MCASQNIQYKPRPARRHKKQGTAESSNEVIRYFVQSLIKESCVAAASSVPAHSDQQVVAPPFFPKNSLIGSIFISSFDFAHGYCPALSGLNHTQVSKHLLSSCYEKSARHAFHRFMPWRNVKCLHQTVLKPSTPVYFFKNGTKRRQWYSGFAKEVNKTYFIVSTTKSLKGYSHTIAYGDFCVQPKSNLLREVEEMELGWNGLVLDEATKRTSEIPMSLPVDNTQQK